MNASEILISLKAKNINYTVIAEAIGVSSGHVRNVAARIFTSREVAEAIAVALEKPFLDVFPEYAEKQPQIKKAKRKQAVDSLRMKIQATQEVL